MWGGRWRDERDGGTEGEEQARDSLNVCQYLQCTFDHMNGRHRSVHSRESMNNGGLSPAQHSGFVMPWSCQFS